MSDLLLDFHDVHLSFAGVKALAVHAGKEGIGLLFQSERPDVYQWLRQIA